MHIIDKHKCLHIFFKWIKLQKWLNVDCLLIYEFKHYNYLLNKVKISFTKNVIVILHNRNYVNIGTTHILSEH